MRPIIIEGPDLVGKSTFAEALKEASGHDLEVRHMSKPAPDFDFYDGFLDTLEEDVVYDRFHVGGYVYGHVLGLHPWNTNVDRQRLLTYKMFIRHSPVIVIMVHYDSDSVDEKWALADRDEMFSPQNVKDANLVYRELAFCRNNATSIVGPGRIYPIQLKGHQFFTQDDVFSILNEAAKS